MSRVLEVEELSCELRTAAGTIRPVDRVSVTLERGKTLGIVGESGSGKSMFVKAIMGVTPPASQVTGRVILNGTDLLGLGRKERHRRLGSEIGMIFQNPMTSLNPVVPIGRQITEGMRFHLGVSRAEAKSRAVDLLHQVGISDPAERLRQYPHHLSGGMRQRVLIAAALACDPDVLIADEATTALDVTVQKQVLDLIREVQRARNMAVIIISHDLGIMARYADDIAVMYVGQVVEMGSVRDVFHDSRHRYTAALLRSIPTLDEGPHAPFGTIPGTLPSLRDLPQGCRFAPRCEAATKECEAASPGVSYAGTSRHWHRCIWPVEARRPEGGPGFDGSQASEENPVE
jgi:peptide/nickel transport system ATP-binding protein